MESSEKHPLNLNSVDFDAEAFVSQLLQRKGLDELVAVEEDMVQNVRRLDSEMQQLVYENYNKFLTATTVVRNMQTQLANTDEEMHALSQKLKDISTLSTSLTNSFSSHRENVKKLTDANRTVKSLRNFVKLPQKLQSLVDQKEYEKAIRIYLSAKTNLEKYRDVQSVAGIFQDSVEIIGKLQEALTERLTSKVATSEEIEEAVQQLRQLGVSDEQLRRTVLNNWKESSGMEITNLERLADYVESQSDILVFTESVCSLLTNLSLSHSLTSKLFGAACEGEVTELMEHHMKKLDSVITLRFEGKHNTRECALFVTALDRVYRKLSACSRLVPVMNLQKFAIDVVVRASRAQVGHHRETIADAVVKFIEDNLSEKSTSLSSQELLSLVNQLEQAFLVAVKSALANLLLFTASDITFATLDPALFFTGFGKEVHEQIVIASVRDLIRLGLDYAGAESVFSKNATYLLIYAQFLRSIKAKHLNYLMDLCQEQYRLNEGNNAEITQHETVLAEVSEAAENVLKHYVHVQGSLIGQLLTSSVESRNWMDNQFEPKSVRAVAQRVVEYVEKTDQQIRTFMDDNTKKERTPDSTRSTSSRKAVSSSYDTSSLSSALEKLWIERSEKASLDFKHDLVLSALIQFFLKSFVEAVRLQFYSTNGFAQIQIDCYYLKQELWKYIADEHILHSLIDDVITAAVSQCDNPKILDPSLIKELCNTMN